MRTPWDLLVLAAIVAIVAAIVAVSGAGVSARCRQLEGVIGAFHSK